MPGKNNKEGKLMLFTKLKNAFKIIINGIKEKNTLKGENGVIVDYGSRKIITKNGKTYDDGRVLETENLPKIPVEQYIELGDENPDKINIEMEVDYIFINPTDEESISAKLSGEATMEIELEHKVEDGNLILRTYKKEDGYDKLTLEVNIPKNKILNKLDCTSNIADICIKDGVKVKSVDVASVRGDINVNLKESIQKANFTTTSGDIDAFITSENNVDVKAQSYNGSPKVVVSAKNANINCITISGDMDIKLLNIKNLILDAANAIDLIRNAHSPNGEYTAYVTARSSTGQIWVM